MVGFNEKKSSEETVADVERVFNKFIKLSDETKEALKQCQNLINNDGNTEGLGTLAEATNSQFEPAAEALNAALENLVEVANTCKKAAVSSARMATSESIT